MENQENLFKDAYFGKSFIMVGKTLPKCLDCSYCRANDSVKKDYMLLPGDINPAFLDIPVAVNIFYGDPMLQPQTTFEILERLEASGHRGPVIIITKCDISYFASLLSSRPRFNLDIHFGLSTFGLDSQYDGGKFSIFERNMEIASSLGYHYSVEFRPIINGINDSDEVFTRVAKIAAEHKTGIGYCGLQMSDNLRERLSSSGISFKPYDGVPFGLKKHMGRDADSRLRRICSSLGVPAFRKTSCIIAWKHGLERDPNAHYYRPNEVGCADCPMKDKCSSFKNSLPDSLPNPDIIPFPYEITDKERHECGLYKLGVCKFLSTDCRNISGKLLKIDSELTTTDVRLIKWLTGYTVDARFTESPYCSNAWLKR